MGDVPSEKDDPRHRDSAPGDLSLLAAAQGNLELALRLIDESGCQAHVGALCEEVIMHVRDAQRARTIAPGIAPGRARTTELE